MGGEWVVSGYRVGSEWVQSGCSVTTLWIQVQRGTEWVQGDYRVGAEWVQGDYRVCTEWVQVQRVSHEYPSPKTVRPDLQVFHTADVNGDGKLTAGEIEKFMDQHSQVTDTTCSNVGWGAGSATMRGG